MEEKAILARLTMEIGYSGYGTSPVLATDLETRRQFADKLHILLSEKREQGVVSLYWLNNYCDASDIQLFGVLVAVMVALRFWLAGLQSSQLLKHQPLQPLFVRWGMKLCPKSKYKFAENLWLGCWHTTSMILCYYAVFFSEWNVNGDRSTRGWPAVFYRDRSPRWYFLSTDDEYNATGVESWPFLPMSPFARAVYTTEVAFWVSSAILLGTETRRSDFGVLMVHHVVTTILLVGSAVLGMYRIGLMVLVVHDPADVLLYFTKCVRYCRTDELLVSCMFGLFAATYFLLRLVLFLLWCVIPSVTLDRSGRLLGGDISQQYLMPGGLVLPIMLVILQCLHFYWFYLIVRIIISTIGGQGVKDSREAESTDEIYSISDDDTPREIGDIKDEEAIPLRAHTE